MRAYRSERTPLKTHIDLGYSHESKKNLSSHCELSTKGCTALLRRMKEAEDQ
jgi:hypothetical protein